MVAVLNRFDRFFFGKKSCSDKKPNFIRQRQGPVISAPRRVGVIALSNLRQALESENPGPEAAAAPFFFICDSDFLSDTD